MIFFHFLSELIVLLSELLTESLKITKEMTQWLIKHAHILQKDCDKAFFNNADHDGGGFIFIFYI